MSGDTIECFNCGHANPSWAQVCRQCGFAVAIDGPASGVPRGIFPTDRASLISIGGAIGAIALAIVLGLLVSNVIPAAPIVASETPSPSASVAALPSVSEAPSAADSLAPSVVPTPTLLGTITFGTGLSSTREITGETTAFRAGIAFAHSIKLTEPFGVTIFQEEVIRVAADGALTVVQQRSDMPPVSVGSTIAGFRVQDAGALVQDWGTGNFILRVYRGAELLAEGHFSLS